LVGQADRGFQFSSFHTTAALVQRFGHRKLRLPLVLNVGGKRPVQTRLQLPA
jgi:hypothetical protein